MKPILIRLDSNQRRAAFLILLVSTLLVMLALNVAGRNLITTAAPLGIISYELAGDPLTSQSILDSWDELAKTSAAFNLGLDYLFLVLYSITIAWGATWLSLLYAANKSWSTLGAVAAGGVIFAACLDAIENYLLMSMLTHGASAPQSQIAYYCALVKFILVFWGIGYILAGFIVFTWHHLAKP